MIAMANKRWLLALVGLFCLGSAVAASAQVPDSDIWVSEILVRGGTLDLGKPVNVTRHAGYDNQPCFLGDSQSFVFTSAVPEGGTDIYRCDLAGGAPRVVRLTRTPESEYSPTPIEPGGTAFCTVRVEADSTQRLWCFDMDGTHPRLALSDVDSVGYFAWIDGTHVAAFVLGNEKKKEPHTLRVIDMTTQAQTTVARDIGRSLQRIPGTGDIIYTLQQADDRYRFFILKNGRTAGVPFTDAVGEGQDAAWLGDIMLHSSGTAIYAARPLQAGASWRPARDFAADGIAGITRMAVAPDHSLIAFVATSSAP
jgi:hypothetical protein